MKEIESSQSDIIRVGGDHVINFVQIITLVYQAIL